MAGAGSAATIDSSLCNIICFIVGVLSNKTSFDGDSKVGHKTIKIDWTKQPVFWPKDIPYKNPNTNLTTPEKWSMLFAALACLMKEDIDKLLTKWDHFVLCVELMALESSCLEIMDECHFLRIFRKQDASHLKKKWVREIYSYHLNSFGLSLTDVSADQKHTYFSSFFDDLEQECNNGKRPTFLQKLKTFNSMKSLKADSALCIAKECLQHVSKRAKNSSKGHNPSSRKRQCPNSGHAADTVTREKRSKKRDTTSTALSIPTLQHATIPTSTSSIPRSQHSKIQLMASPKSTTQYSTLQQTASTIPTTEYSTVQQTASPVPPTEYSTVQQTASPIPTTEYSTVQQTASPVPTTDYSTLQQTASSIPTTECTMVQQIESPVPTTEYSTVQQTASPVPTTEYSTVQQTASPIPTTEYSTVQQTASPIPTTEYSTVQQTASPVTSTQNSTLQQTASPMSATRNSAKLNTKITIPLISNDPLMSSSGSHQFILPVDTSDRSLYDQARNTFNNSLLSGTWSPSEDYCELFDDLFTVPDFS
ncbi:uncharacterized protein LOC132565277 [Ylistrum balloti]|uniref:uncharacterized protein LOC132565277 n=1 Tax=Ylistrum balloti TaxID=509963 RepID=UPI002905B43B|nr:uncharacterized protein LOC132565277 [Ylistrum balloti]